MSTILKLTLLGKPQTYLNGELVTAFGTQKAQALFYFLAVTGTVHSRHALAALFWSEDSEENAKNSLRVALSGLRRLIPDHLTITRQTIAFNHESNFTLDIHVFDQQTETKLNHTDALDIQVLEQLIKLYRGDFLEDFHVDDAPFFEEWLLTERVRRRQIAIELLHRLTNHYVTVRAYEQAIRTLKRLLLLEPWDEAAHRTLMETLSRIGDFNAALSQYDQCYQILVDELDVEPMPETTELYRRIQAARAARRHNLPPESTPFIGRAKELEQLIAMVSEPDCRLVTIVGLGGIGKSRLALQAARQICAEQALLFLNGVIYVSLTNIVDAEQATLALADALELKVAGREDPLLRVQKQLENKEILLLLDSFEYLLPGDEGPTAQPQVDGIEFVTQLLSASSDLKILVTSREPLQMSAEWRLDLSGLTYPQMVLSPGENTIGQTLPNPSESPVISDVSRHGAVQLFLQTAEQISPGFDLSPATSVDIIRICQLLGGIPLAIKLAAAWLRAMPSERIVTEIERNIDFLSTQMRDVIPRQRSLRAVFDHSWTLLNQEEQLAFQNLSVFADSFTENAAQQVANVSLFHLISLLDKSLVQHDSASGSPETKMHKNLDQHKGHTMQTRYAMHQVVRQYAAERLHSAEDSAENMYTQLCNYYVSFLQRQEERFAGTDEAEAIAAIAEEIANIRAAWDWAVSHLMLSQIQCMIPSLSRFYLLHGPFQVAESLFGRAADKLTTYLATLNPPQTGETASVLLSQLLLEQGRFQTERANYDDALNTINRAATLAVQFDVVELQAASALASATVYYWTGNHRQAQPQIERALSLVEIADLRQIEADSLRLLGNLHLFRSEYAKAKIYYERDLTILRKITNRRNESRTLNNLGVVSLELGDYERARSYYEESLNLFTEIGDRWGESHLQNNLGRALAEQGELFESLSYLEKAHQTKKELGDRLGVSNALLSLGRTYMYLGYYAQADTYYEQSYGVVQN